MIDRQPATTHQPTTHAGATQSQNNLAAESWGKTPLGKPGVDHNVAVTGGRWRLIALVPGLPGDDVWRSVRATAEDGYCPRGAFACWSV